MASTIDRHQVLRLIAEENAQLVDVLPKAEFEAEHLPGAINVALKVLNRTTASVLRRDRPVIVY